MLFCCNSVYTSFITKIYDDVGKTHAMEYITSVAMKIKRCFYTALAGLIRASTV